MTLPFDLPAELALLTAARTWEPVEVGRSGAAVYQARDCFLKVQPRDLSPHLFLESDRLEWLGGHLPVPEVWFYGAHDHYEFLLTSRVAGQDLSQVALHNPETAARLFARALRKWHQLPINQCPFDRSWEVRMAEARSHLRMGQLDLSKFPDAAPDTLLEHLEAHPPVPDLVVSHGDFCFPNVLVQAQDLSGFVDVGLCGVSDRWTDLTLALWSLEYNCGPGWDTVFWQEYGLATDDPQKRRLFSLLDRFS